MQVSGIVGAPSTASLADSAQPIALAGKAGEMMTAELHAPFYTWAYRGWGFIGSTLVAGVVTPAYNSTSQVFGIFNPGGNTRNAVLETLDIGYVSTTPAVTNYGISYSSTVGAAPATGGSVSAATFIAPLNQVIGGGNTNTVKFVQSTATVTAPSYLMTLGYSYQSTALVGASQQHYDFAGKLIVPPNVAVWLVGTTTISATVDASLTWYEAPL